MTVVRVPTDIFSGLEGAPSRSLRLLTTAWVLSDGAAGDKAALRAAPRLWASSALQRGGAVNVLSVLLELEGMGVCDVMDERDGFFEVERKAAAA